MTTETTERPNVEYGDREIAMHNQILRSTVGSGVHGIAIEGTDDHDEMGIYIEPPEYVLGLNPNPEVRRRRNYISRTKPEGVRSGPGDTDLVMYSLREYLRLAVKGNPTALLPLFSPEEHLLYVNQFGHELRSMRNLFLSQEAVERFLGYMYAQHERMLGYGKRNKVPNRPELIEKHGWDTKYGAHALRLAYQGREVCMSGSLTLPMPEALRLSVLEVKQGLVEQEKVSEMIDTLAKQTKDWLESGKCYLPQRANLGIINSFSTYAHLEHWEMTQQ